MTNQLRRRFERACASLYGLAVGDALGMPTQTLSRGDILERYGEVKGFREPYQDHPVAGGLKAGQVTDDTEQSFLLAKRLISGSGCIDELLWAADLLRWEESIKNRGLRDLLGPSTKTALEAVSRGEPVEVSGRFGTTNGAAMRIAPVGIAFSAESVSKLVAQVESASRMTHNTGEAIATASAVATVISLGIDGLDFNEAAEKALVAAEIGQGKGYNAGHTEIASQLNDAMVLAQSGLGTEEIARRIGTSVAAQESVPMAFAIVMLAKGNPWQATLLAANVGDDTDTIGAIAGAMAGACSGLTSYSEETLSTIRTVNDLTVEETVENLLALRDTNQ